MTDELTKDAVDEIEQSEHTLIDLVFYSALAYGEGTLTAERFAAVVYVAAREHGAVLEKYFA